MANKKPYARNNMTVSKKENKNKNKNINKKKVSDDSPKVRLDKERINDVETLDTSFLEGRINNKKSKAVKEKILNDKEGINLTYLKYTLISAVALAFFVVFCSLLGNVVNNLGNDNNDKKDVSTQPIVEVEMDDNYLFIGTFNTKRLNFYEDYHYIKISEDHYNTNDILNEMNKQVYQYNPTYVFIELGINELYVEESNDDFIERLGKIIDGIKENRPMAKIYVESIYPINKNVDNFDDTLIKDYIDNELISTVNKDIKKMVNSKEVNYLDLYNLLIEDDNLIKDYTDNGIYLNDRGFKVVYDEINKIIG